MTDRYVTAVPLMNVPFQRTGPKKETTVNRLKALGVTRIFLAMASDCLLEPKRGEELAALRDNCAYLKSEGFEVGAWLWAFLLREDRGYTRMEAPDGTVSKMTVCPLPKYPSSQRTFTSSAVVFFSSS